MITVEDREAIRKAYYLEHKSIRQIAREQYHSRSTIRKALKDIQPQPYQRARVMCFFGIHQGEWTTEGCQQRRFCIHCGKPESREVHNWSTQWAYVRRGSCETRVKCIDCRKTKSSGKYHEGEIGIPHGGNWWDGNWWDSRCKRCGEELENTDWG